MKNSPIPKIKVALLVDYYPPFTPGGSEWSVYYLAKQLRIDNIDSVILTPNYGAKDEEILDGIQIFRLPIFVKAKDNFSVINPVFQNNPLFFVWSSLFIYKIAKANQIKVLHVNGKYLIPGAWIAAKLLGIPFLVTIRDKHLLCNYGRCFFDQDRYKACNFWEFLTVEMPWFYKNYIPKKTLGAGLFVLFSGLYTRFANSIIMFFALRADKVITISKAQKKYMESNGFKNVKVIYNSYIFPQLNNQKKRSGVLYAGKLSRGKGVYLLLEAIPKVLKKHNEKFIFAGGIDEKEQINKKINSLKIKNNVSLLGGISHEQLKKLYLKAKLVVQPSIYPESFGRVALEGLAAGTPVVVTDKGGLPEIINNGFDGEVSNLNSDDLADKINKILDHEKKYLQNVIKSRGDLLKKFEVDPIKQHVLLYKHFENKRK